MQPYVHVQTGVVSTYHQILGYGPLGKKNHKQECSAVLPWMSFKSSFRKLFKMHIYK